MMMKLHHDPATENAVEKRYAIVAMERFQRCAAATQFTVRNVAKTPQKADGKEARKPEVEGVQKRWKKPHIKRTNKILIRRKIMFVSADKLYELKDSYRRPPSYPNATYVRPMCSGYFRRVACIMFDSEMKIVSETYIVQVHHFGAVVEELEGL